MQSTGNSIFVGLKLCDKLRDQLDSSNASAKQFFKEDNPEYLQVLYIDHEEYIGKVTESSASLEALGNMCQNVRTMLRMICPKFSVSEDAIRVLAVAPAQAGSYR